MATTAGSSGNDDLGPQATELADLVAGNDGSGSINGLGGNDTLWGDDIVADASGDGGDDSILGGGGNDTLVGGAGDDSLLAGDGNDTADYSPATLRVTALHNSTLFGGEGFSLVDSDGRGTLRGVETLPGGTGDD